MGQKIEKFFKGYGTFVGKISELPSEDMPYYRVHYEDTCSDGEDIHEDDISEYVVGAAFPGSSEARRLSNCSKCRCQVSVALKKAFALLLIIEVHSTRRQSERLGKEMNGGRRKKIDISSIMMGRTFNHALDHLVANTRASLRRG